MSTTELEDTGERLIVKGNEQTLTYGEHLSRYSSVLRLVKGKVVLDIASGTGYGSQMIAQHAKQVIGVDYSPEAVTYSKKHYSAPNLMYMVGDAHHLDVADHSVDVVVSFETIEHLADPTKFVKEVKRVLKKDGIFVASTPNDAEFMEGNVFHIHEFEFPELKRLIKANFDHYQFYYQGTWFTAGLLGEQAFTRPMASQPIVVHKTFSQPTKKAIFFIAIASGEKLVDLEENIVIADRWSSKEDIERDIVRREANVSRDAELNRITAEREKYKQYSVELEKKLERIRSTKWWKARSTAGKIRRKLS
jgi:ubiquinone/menaquinone biosynthesis C-methylase UbiE